MVWYKVGAADDPRGKSGSAHFLEHLMFKGTKAHPPGAFGALIAQNGGRDNAFTSEDYTAFHETVARERLDLVMRLEADRMTGLVLDDAAVLSEREVVLEERRMRIDNDPSALLREQLRQSVPQQLRRGCRRSAGNPRSASSARRTRSHFTATGTCRTTRC